MENNIEEIWEKGNHGSITKTDFYNRKTTLWYQKIIAVMKKDQRLLIPVSATVVLLLLFHKKYDGAIAAALFLGIHYLFNHFVLTKFLFLELGEDAYSFLTMYRQIIKKYTWYMATLFPLGMMGVLWAVCKNSDAFTKVSLAVSFETAVIISISLYILLAIFSVGIYLLTTQKLYGTLLKKLDRLLYNFDLNK